MKNKLKPLLVGFFGAMLLSSTVLAESYYWVSGNSMYPTLQDGDLVEVISEDYKEGDIVVAETKLGEEIIKRVEGNKLIGESANSINYDIDSVVVLGKVENVKEEKNIEVVNITQQAKALEIDSPIKKAYAGAEFVLFLHEDTSVTGFGSNVANVLGTTGDITNNTGELVKVADLTGFEKIITGVQNAFGLRPHDTEVGMYHLSRFNHTINTNPYTVSELVKDVALVGYHGGNPHQATSYIDSEGFVRTRGSDYWIHLGIGNYKPHNRYPGGSTFVLDNSLQHWLRVLAPNGEPIIYPTTGTGYFLSNEDNSASGVSMITPSFDISKDIFTIETRLRNFAPHPTLDRNVDRNDTSVINFIIEVYDGSLTDVEINSGIYTPIVTWNNPHRDGYAMGNVAHRVVNSDLEGLPSKSYKIKISSQYVGWDVRIKDRIFLENAQRVLYRHSRRHFTIIDENNNVYINAGYGDGLVRPVVFNGIEQEVNIRPETAMGGGDNSWYGVIDTNGRLWTWNSTSANLVSFPDIGLEPFYNIYEIIDVSVGNGFTMAISRHRNTRETNVWVWGSNSYGKLGLNDSSSSVSVPTMLLQPDGNPMNNIQSIAAGQHFSVVVQNTEEGQLVWTAGRNNAGQLGGGVTLTSNKPQLVPGLSKISKVAGDGTNAYAFSDEDQAIYRFGGGLSYVVPHSFHSNVGYPKKFDLGLRYVYTSLGFINQNDQLIKSHGHSGGGPNWGIPRVFEGTLWLNQSGEFYEENNRTLYNNGNEYLEAVKDLAITQRRMFAVDKKGMVWLGMYSYPSRAGNGYGAGPYYNSVGQHINYSYPYQGVQSGGWTQLRPIKTTWQTDAPSIFEKIAVPKWTQYGGRAYAVTTEGKLWEIGVYASLMNNPINDHTITEIFSGKWNVHILDDLGRVWAVGNDRRGLLGNGSVSGSTTSPNMIDPTYFNNEKIVHVSSGEYVTLFVTETGEVYVAGENYFGLFASDEYTEGHREIVPVKIDALSNITYVYSGEDFALAVDKEGRVWSWGNSTNGSLGDGFTINREVSGTAVGNETPNLFVDAPIRTYYLSPNGNSEFRLFGYITEHDRENTSISTTILGVEKEIILERDSWTTDAYERVEQQNWELNWSVGEFDSNLNYQSLTKVVALDERGGIKEQFFSGEIIVDGEIPQTPTWGQTCLLDGNNLETNCSSTPMFEAGGTNGVNQPIRLYLNVSQKTGDNKAPVYPEISFRKKTTGGFYLNDWSEWTEVKTKNESGYYIDIFQGFQGETQFKLRTKDKAGNIAPEQSESRYTIIANAGAEVDKIVISPKLENNIVLNELKFTAQTVSGSALVSYDIKRWLVGDYNKIETDEGDVVFEEKWQDLFETRQTWEGEEITFLDNSLDLFGNAEYKYHVDAENTVAIGRPMFEKVFTMPYEPENFSRAPRNDGLGLSLTQDKRNKGEILYRLVLVDNMTGDIYSEDRVSSNRNEDIIFDLNDSEVPIQIVNNSIQIKLIVRGSNGLFHTIVYDEDFINSPAIANDDEAPNAQVSIEGNTTIQNTGENLINLNLFATDNFSPTNVLQVQFSSDGSRWFGFDTTTSTWRENNWSKYSTKFSGYPMGTQTGNRVVYVRVRDEAGNIGYGNTSLQIVDPIDRGDAINIIDDEFAIVSPDEPYMHVNKNRRELIIPKPTSGNISEVQFSFDGIVWSGWEVIPEEGLRKIFSLEGSNGYKTIYTRYRNEFGATTTVTETDVREYAFDTEAPTANIQTEHFSLVVRENTVNLLITATDNLSDIIGMKLIGPTGLSTTPIDFYAGVSLQKGSEYEVPISGLLEGPNNLRFEFTDKAGNTGIEEIRIIYRQ